MITFQQSLRERYQAGLLSQRPPLSLGVEVRLALVHRGKPPEVHSPFYQSTMDPLRERICYFKEPFEFSNLFHVSDGAQKIVVLLLGMAGCGKTHLCLDIVHKWAAKNSHQQFQLVFYIPVETYGGINFVDETDLLLTCFPESATADAVAQVVRTGGANCLVLIDGADKIPLPVFQDSLLHKIVNGSCLKNAAVVVTGRPHLLKPFLPFSSHQLEVLPLPAETVLEIAKELGGGGVQGSILKHLLSDNPHIAEYCTNPAVLTAICDTFKLTSSIETTLTANLTKLITLQQPSLTAILPLRDTQPFPTEFQKLSQLAKKGLFDGQVSFSEDDLETPIEDLPDSNPLFRVDTIPGKGKHFYFPSKVTQSYLAACHLATLSEEAQVEMFVKHAKDPALLFTWLFFAGLTKLANTSIVISALKFYIDNKNPFGHARLQLLLFCMLEAHVPSVCQQVGSLLKLEPQSPLVADLDQTLLEMELQLSGSVLQMDSVTPLDLVAIGYFVCHSCIKVRLLLMDCDITPAKLRVFADAVHKFSVDNSSGIQELK